MYPRFLEAALLESLKDTPVTLISGARQTGKTTLAQAVASELHPAQYITLDDTGFLAAATSDPGGFIAGLQGPVIIDEIQRATELFPAIKAAVDRNRQPGRFLLTGSANVMLLPKLSDSLAGRMEILTLWPLSQAEIAGKGSGLIDYLFADTLPIPMVQPLPRGDLIDRILAGGYPEPLSRTTTARRRAWFASYLNSILQRDVRDIANIEGLTDMPRLLSIMASRMASLLNTADISRDSGIPYTTLHRYMSLLQSTFLVQLLPAWSANLGLRLVRSPKLLFNDPGLAASFIGVDARRLQDDGSLFGHVFENFVIMEVIKAIGPSDAQPISHHFRTTAGSEVDLVLETPNGRIVAIEIKASATVGVKDFRGIKSLAGAAGDRLHRGIVFYTGDGVIPFGERLHAVPVQAMWSLP